MKQNFTPKLEKYGKQWDMKLQYFPTIRMKLVGKLLGKL